MINKNKFKHISFSELNDWYRCPVYHDLKWVKRDEKAFKPNLFTIAGSSIHEVLENQPKNIHLNLKEVYEKYLSEYEDFKVKFNIEENLDSNLRDLLFEQMSVFPEKVPEAMRAKFGDFTEIGSEIQLYEEIEGLPETYEKRYFKAFIDRAIQLESGRHVLIDWKLVSYWNSRQKNTKEVTYQLTYYKHFYSKKYNVDPKLIDCYFVALQRVSGKIKFVEVKVGNKKIENALAYLKKALTNINKKVYVKKTMNCVDKFNNTCPYKLNGQCRNWRRSG